MTGKYSANRGRLYELSVGFHLNNGDHVVNLEPEKYEIPVITEELRVNYDDYERLNGHAKETAEFIKTNLFIRNYGQVDEVAWVANGKGYERYTDKISNGAQADLMLKLQSTDVSSSYNLVGISLKYAKNDPALRNTSIKSFEEKMKLPEGCLQKYHHKHIENTKQYGFTEPTQEQNHAKWRVIRDEPDHTPLGKLKTIINRSSNGSRRDIAKEIAKQLNRLDTSVLIDGISEYISPTAPITEYQVCTCPVNGSMSFIDLKSQIKEILSSAADITIQANNGTICYILVDGKKTIALEVVNKGRPLKNPEVKSMVRIV